MNKQLQQALAARDEALAAMNIKAVKLAGLNLARATAASEHLPLIQAAGDATAQELEAAIEALEDAQVSVAYWRAVERGRQQLG